MLEKYLSRILTSKFEHIVEDFDEKAINISTWKGEVSLQNLILKKNALDAFYEDSPVDIVYGNIGKLELRIPWSSLGTKSSSIILTDVSLVITPRDVEQWTEEQRRRMKQQKKTLSKEERVQAHLNPRILGHSIAASHKKNRLARFLSWVSSSLFSNLSVTVRNIHVRYEDSGSSLGFVWNNHSSQSPFAVGLTLKQFSVQTTTINDENNDKVPKNCSVTRKIAAAHQLAVYWDHSSPLIAMALRQEINPEAARKHAAEALLIMENHEAPVTSTMTQQYRRIHSYLLLPVSPSLQFNLVVSGGPAQDKLVPPSTVIMSLPPCHFEISRAVLANVAYLRKSFAYWKQFRISEELNETLAHLKRIRPIVSPRQDVKSWWRYAIEAIIVLSRSHGQQRRRRGWSALAHAIIERRRYIVLYQQLMPLCSFEAAHSLLCTMEEKLDVGEIVSFRLAAYEMMVEAHLPDLKPEPKNSDADDLVFEIASGKLSATGRRNMMHDAIRMLKEGRKVASKDECVSEQPVSGRDEASVQWITSLFCPEMSLQINGQSSGNTFKPVAKLSFACVERQYLRRDGSWELDATVAAVKLIDMSIGRSVFPTLIVTKPSLDLRDEDFVIVSGQRFRQCIHVEVKRTFTKYQDCIGSTTHSILRLQPLEVVVSANAVERLTSVFSPIQTPELAGDFERMSSVVSKWREQQRQRLIQALAHKRKRITVDLDIAAPVIMIPEALNRGDRSGEMLVVDLGRLQLKNVEHDDSFDDVWKLELSDMQVQNSRFLSRKDFSSRLLQQQIIEPFSLEFKISTNFVLRQRSSDPLNSTSVVIDASLPRIVFNLKTSSLRLMSRIYNELTFLRRPSSNRRQHSLNGNGNRCTVHLDRRKDDDDSNQRLRPSRVFIFNFSAPIIAIKLENDVDAEGPPEANDASTPLVNLAFRGIRGTFTQHVTGFGLPTIDFVARMKALEAVDLYQQAGHGFALLLSSVRPTSMPNIPLHTLVEQPEDLIHPQFKTDLVSVTYELRSFPCKVNSERRPRNESSVSIKFHELFVEWNPETIAAIHKATRVEPLPKSDGSDEEISSDSDEEFFDAFEDHAESFRSASNENDDEGSHIISEISSSHSSLFLQAENLDDNLLKTPTRHERAWSPTWMTSGSKVRWMNSPLQPAFVAPLSPINIATLRALDNEVTDDKVSAHQPFDLSFNLSTLQVSFNKETRHRRLIMAEMDNILVQFSTRAGGGSRTVARIGNLVFVDPCSSEGKTLYNQILGLTTQGVTNTEESSLLELEFITNASERNFESGLHRHDLLSNQNRSDGHLDGVTINTDRGEIRGCNNFVSLAFSPMRFVYLQQLWFEIIDYFFEGITGYEVWGNKRPKQEPSMEVFAPQDPSIVEGDEQRTSDLPGSMAEGINFTCFKVTLMSPEVLLPIHYNSPHFIRFTSQSLEFSNQYTSCVYQVLNGRFQSRDRVQWFNNCSIHFQSIRFQSWLGNDLTLGSDGIRRNPDIRMKMSWPTGPTRQMVAPKWRVSCILDEIDLSLRQEDYALVQHVILHNIGEPSRHIDEWIRFQEMPIAELEAYKDKIMVHYGYDKKDAEPSTYDVEVVAPLLLVNIMGGPHEAVIARAMCLNLSWKMHRLRDLVSQQRVATNVVLVKPLEGGHNDKSLSLLLPTKRGTARDDRPDVVFTSTTKTSGENVKTLQVFDAGINFSYPAWLDLLTFFSNLGEPSILTPYEVLNSVQIGDRWYSISSQKLKDTTATEDSVDDSSARLSQSKTNAVIRTFCFRLLLESPRIVLESGNEGNSVTLHMEHLDFLSVNDIVAQTSTKSFFIHDLELYTVTDTSEHRDLYSVENSLISPWSFLGHVKTQVGVDQSGCSSRSVQLAAEVLKARAAYSDMVVALDVSHQLLHDMNLQQNRKDVTRKSETSAKNSLNRQAAETTPNVWFDSFVHIDGIEIMVVDDSLRHFASSQEMVSLSLGPIVHLYERFSDVHSMKFESSVTRPIESEGPGSLCIVRVANIDLIDHLQASTSRFRLAATSRADTNASPLLSEYSPRILEWQLFSTIGNSFTGFEPSPHLLQLLQSRYSTLSSIDCKWSGVYDDITFGSLSRKVKVDAQNFAIQWNPSTVIALQRFLGRFLKEVQLKSNIDDLTASPVQSTLISDNAIRGESKLPVDVSFSLGKLSACLNKEHQNRRLLTATLTAISVSMTIDANANSTFIGVVSDVQVWDDDTYASMGILQQNRALVSVARDLNGEFDVGKFPFVNFIYSTFAKGNVGHQRALPTWIEEKLMSDSKFQGIDDYLSVSIAPVHFTYIRGRTEELVDYLSNGLPGKGMGLTSSAAKGFINKRIQTQSFLSLTIAAPLLRIPEHEDSSDGVVLHLGDMHLKTWFEPEDVGKGQATQYWSRVVEVSVLGLGWNVYGRRKLQRDDYLPVDLHFDLRKPGKIARAIEISGRLSFVMLHLRYTDYLLLRNVFNLNIGRKTDTSRWDNIEKAYWMESMEVHESTDHETSSADKRVAYSSSARFVRYGPKEQRSEKMSEDMIAGKSDDKILDFLFKMDGIRLTLHRDDDIDNSTHTEDSSHLHYDIILLKLEEVSVSFSMALDGDTSLIMSLSQLSMYDLGDCGRIAREHYTLQHATASTSEGGALPYFSGLRSPSVFSVIAEGYHTSEEVASTMSSSADAVQQLVLTVDTCPYSSVGETTSSEIDRATIVRMVINYLSINAMIKPLREVVSFLSCSWSLSKEMPLQKSSDGTSILSGQDINENKSALSGSFLQFKLVAHYPRVFFVADESDPNSRALVLKGLAVVNASVFNEFASVAGATSHEITRVLALDANLQSLESFINPDVSDALGRKPDGSTANPTSDLRALGVALIQPVTAGIEFKQTSKERFPTIRSLNLNMESVSTMLSFEDLGLINQVIKRWSSGSSSRKVQEQAALESNSVQVTKFEVIFHSARLGLMLKKNADSVVVDRLETRSGRIMEGDRLLMVDEIDISGRSLHQIVKLLSLRPRPMKLLFSRTPISYEIEATSKRIDHEDLSANLDSGPCMETPINTKSLCYKLHFKIGKPNGITLERSHVGDIPVVSSVNFSDLSEALVGVDEAVCKCPDPLSQDNLTRVPLSGTAVIAVSALKSVDIGYDETFRLLLEFERTTETNPKGDFGEYSISFLELSSDAWGSVDTFDSCIAGVALTFIDDFQGRDMPLFRGKLDFIELHCDRGIGLHTEKIDTATASVFGAIVDAVELSSSKDLVEYSTVAMGELHRERILRLSGSYQSEVDYYHPRVAVWEPFLEPSQLAISLVWKPGTCFRSVKRPGQLAIEVSDRLDAMRRQTLERNSMSTNAVTLNITDAAAEVFARTLRQFSKWKKALHVEESLDDCRRTTLQEENLKGPAVASERRVRSMKYAATREAAQAALVFAQKRGVHTQMKNDFAKPFLFRNKTGIDLYFCVYRTPSSDGAMYSSRQHVAAGCETRFQLEVMAHKDDVSIVGDAENRSGKKVRSYDGRFPPLGVWIEAVDGAVTEPLLDLPVSRVGTFVRELKIIHDENESQDGKSFAVPVIWRIELNDNRRILTLSSAVQISSVAFGLHVDLGFTKRDKSKGEPLIEYLCTISPGESYFLPLWMALGLDVRQIFARPSSPMPTDSFGWGLVSILTYENHSPRWTSSESLCTLVCSTPRVPQYKVDMIWLSCLNTPLVVDGVKGDSLKKMTEKKKEGIREVHGVINVEMDSGITIRNMLPIPVDWEIANNLRSVLDGSTVRCDDDDRSSLKSGARVEVFSCNVSRSDFLLRLRPMSKLPWTDWVVVSTPKGKLKSGEEEYLSESQAPLVQHLNVHTIDDFGVPVRFGIRILSKVHHSNHGRPRCYGLELVLFTELWFQNRTDLQLSFGCPWAQLNSRSPLDATLDDSSSFESSTKATAESALLEIASVLEFGERGKGLRAEEQIMQGVHLCSVPLQSSGQQVYEVFEYMEVNGSVVNRRWWAGEHYDSQGIDIVNLPNRGSYWKWVEDSWRLDGSGNVKKSEGAWESCRSLTAGRDSYFSGQRMFDESHVFRRRRWYRSYSSDRGSLKFQDGVHAFHHPMSAKNTTAGQGTNDIGLPNVDMAHHHFCLRNVGGEWSNIIQLPLSGSAGGVIRVLATRWPSVTRASASFSGTSGSVSETNLRPDLYELCYQVTDLPGEWGDFSRLISIMPRFHVRNESSTSIYEVKQVGVLDSEAIRVFPGDVVPFYWQDFRLPALVCARPLRLDSSAYQWSGGFDICTLGALPLRIRPKSVGECEPHSLKVTMELRPNSSGVDVLFRDEDADGVGAMFRIENNTPFALWVAQDGVLANPSRSQDHMTLEEAEARRRRSQVQNLSDRPPEVDGDVVFPHSRRVFALDVPFRQGKYANRKSASFQELLRVRIGLAPLSTRSGVETTKVIGLTSVGDGVRLNPTKLVHMSSLAKEMSGIRVLGVVVTDGPTRVLRFHLMQKESPGHPIANNLMKQSGYRSTGGHSSFTSTTRSEGEEILLRNLMKGGQECLELKSSGKIPNENDVRRAVFFSQRELDFDSNGLENDIVFSFSGHFAGFLFSLIDAAPAEIATVAIKGLDAAAKWNMNRSNDATALVSVAWIQVDNHVPNAPYPVAVCPDQCYKISVPEELARVPVLMITLKFAPKHQSGVLCLRQVTIAPSNLVIAIDLAFVVRLQGLLLGIRDHFTRGENCMNLADQELIPLPDIATTLTTYGRSESDSLKLYFEGLVVLPSNVNLSVAPARGLTSAQAQIEGSHAAGIHAAVRKGDVRFADGGVVGVSVGKKNRTAMAVVRGVFKSILVDTLLRLDGATVHFAGLSLQNFESSGQQLKAFIATHYLASLRENMPFLLGSLAAFGNPLGLIRGIGDGVSDFVSEPVKGLKKSVEELDPVYVVDGVARGTESLARHTVGGIAGSASMLTETFSKNMTVLTLDRRYAQRRDKARSNQNEDLNFVEGIESGVAQLVRGVIEGVTGLVKAPIRGAEKNGLEGFAKGIGKGLLGLLVKPVIGLSDAATDVMIGVKGSVDGGRQSGRGVHKLPQLRPRRTLYGKDRTLRIYSLADAAASILMQRTKLAGDFYVSHVDMGDKVLLVSDKRFVLLGPDGQELLLVKFKHIHSVELHQICEDERDFEWGVFITLLGRGRMDAKFVEVLRCGDNYAVATSLCNQLQRGLDIVSSSESPR